MKYSNHGPVDRLVPFAMTLSDVQVHSSFQKNTFLRFSTDVSKKVRYDALKIRSFGAPCISHAFDPFCAICTCHVTRSVASKQ